MTLWELIVMLWHHNPLGLAVCALPFVILTMALFHKDRDDA